MNNPPYQQVCAACAGTPHKYGVVLGTGVCDKCSTSTYVAAVFDYGLDSRLKPIAPSAE